MNIVEAIEISTLVAVKKIDNFNELIILKHFKTQKGTLLTLSLSF